MDKIAILLSSYQGQSFIAQQIESILGQSYPHWHLYIRDDGSRDNTPAIIEEYARTYDNISVIEAGHGNFGVVQSFFKLLQAVEARYYMFCDQDDVWLPEKIALTLEKMQALEAAGQQPYLVHTDLKVVDQALKPIGDSLFALQKMSAGNTSLKQLLVQNNVTGCTVMINHEVKQLVKLHPHIAMHDWWLALLAAAFGATGFIARPTMLYRQHGKNGVGASRYGVGYLFTRLVQAKKTLLLQKRNFLQAQAFLALYGAQLPAAEKEMLGAYAGLLNQSFLPKARQFFKYRFFKNNFSRSVIFFLVTMFFLR